MEETRLGIPLIIGRDVIYGHHTVFPIPLAQAASWDTEAVSGAAATMCKEAAADNIRWTYAPMLDIARDPRWGRIIEGYGEDPFLVSAMARSSVAGIARSGMAACAKHFVGYGAAEGGRDYNNTEISDYTLRNVYLPPFKAAIDAGLTTIMSAFNDVNGVPVSGSRRLLTDILKNEFGFDGFVYSDWDAVAQLVEQGVARDLKEACEIAINAGVDMDNPHECFVTHLPELLAEGKVSRERLDDAVRRVLRAKFRIGLFDMKPTVPARPEYAFEQARSLAAGGMVLLQNNDNLLPLPKKGVKIAVVGPMAGERRAHLGSWMLDGKTEDVVTVLEGVRAAAPEAEIITPISGLADDVITACRGADYVIAAVGESHDRTGEARSVADIALSPDQAALIREISRFNRNIAAVVCAGRPLALTNIVDHAKAVLYAWHSGHTAGLAAADVLFGDANPSGRLPVTFPRATGQIPLYYNHRSAGRKIDEYYGGHEFNNYQDCPGSPLYPFGYGLSYTEFRYGEPYADKTGIEPGGTVTVSVEVTNAGKRAGVETVQCYVRDHVAGVMRPKRELKGFRRVFLEPGETKTVSFALGTTELSFYGADGELRAEPGTFSAYIGGDCLAKGRVEFELKG